MRFILRSAFWLTAAFMVIAPTTGNDMGVVAGDAGAQMMAGSQSLIAAGLEQMSCDSFECNLGRTLIVGALPATSPSDTVPMQDNALAGAAPVPPVRPDWAY